LGPLIVFETLAGLLYTFILRQEIPPFLTLSGIALLVAGVVIAVRAKPEKSDRRSGPGTLISYWLKLYAPRKSYSLALKMHLKYNFILLQMR
ncbi:hypothetical protein LFZ31_06155, partial [Salmonella enterica subsp. enterica serovar Newport str. S09097]